MEASFCVAALEEALTKHGKPEIVDTDQGAQFTGETLTDLPITNGIMISMMAKGLGVTTCSSSAYGGP
jgi:putative transposase